MQNASSKIPTCTAFHTAMHDTLYIYFWSLQHPQTFPEFLSLSACRSLFFATLHYHAVKLYSTKSPNCKVQGRKPVCFADYLGRSVSWGSWIFRERFLSTPQGSCVRLLTRHVASSLSLAPLDLYNCPQVCTILHSC